MPFNQAVGFGFQKVISLFSFQDPNFIEGAAAVAHTEITDLI